MKKLMFSALACVAFAFSGFASNEVVEVKEFIKDLKESVNSTNESQIKNEEEPEVWVGCESRVTIKNPIGDGYITIIKKGIVYSETYIGYVACLGFHTAHLSQYPKEMIVSTN